MKGYLIFRLATEVFGLEIEKVVEIFKSREVHKVPQSSEYVMGVITVRGDVIPIIDMRRRLGLEPSPKKERIVLVSTSIETLGLIVDEVLEIVDLEESEIKRSVTVSRGLSSDYLEGMVKKEERVILLLDIDRLLTSDEKISLQSAKSLHEVKE